MIYFLSNLHMLYILAFNTNGSVGLGEEERLSLKYAAR